MKTSPAQQNVIPLQSFWSVEVIARIGNLLCAFCVIVYCIWSLDRGFEITDEAYYILLASDAGTQKLYISAQHWITNWLWQITGSLAMFRAMGMAILLGASTLLALGTYSVCQRFRLIEDSAQTKWGVVAGSVTCAMLYASTINFSPCYNLLASAGTYAAAGLVLLGAHRFSIAQKNLLYLFAGCAVGVEVLCKASAGASTFIILITWLYVFERSFFNRVLGTVAIVAGGIFFVGIALLSNTTISEAAKAIGQGMQLFKIVQVEAIDARLIRYAVQFGHNIIATIVSFSTPLALFAIYAKTRNILFAKLALCVLFVTLLYGGYLLGGWNEGASFTPPFAIVAMMIMALVVSIPFFEKNYQVFVLLGGLIFLPYSVAMGTGNTLFTQVIISLAPWGALIGVLVVSRFPREISKIPLSLIGLCFFATVSSQIITSGFRPYNISTPLIHQDIEFSTENLGIIKIDNETKKFLTDIKLAAKSCNVAPRTPFLGLYNIPGVALALQATPLLSPWLNNVAQAEFVLERTNSNALQSIIVAINYGDSMRLPSLPRQLSGFPDNYKFCGEAIYPFMKQRIEIWQLKI